MISIFTTLYFLHGPFGPFSPAGGSNVLKLLPTIGSGARAHTLCYLNTYTRTIRGVTT